jgi:trehalose 6-phosphate synthase
VLSEFAGAADELRQAYMVNPYDINGMKDAIVTAIRADAKEQSRRMKAMRRTVTEHDVKAWAREFLDVLGEITPEHHKKVRPVPTDD